MAQKSVVGIAVSLLVSVVFLGDAFSLTPMATGKVLVKAPYGVMASGQASVVEAVDVDNQDVGEGLSGPMLSANQQTSVQIFLPIALSRANTCTSIPDYNETINYNIAAVGAVDVWNCFQGQGVTVAVIDTGVDLDHPDLQGNLVAGQTFVSGTTSPDDDHGHGTHVAGIVGGVGNNGGIIGVAPRASVLPVKVIDSQGNGAFFDIANGIRWAADNGAQVINLSLGSVSYSSTLVDAVDYAYGQGVLVIAAAGNCGDSFYFLNGCTSQDQPLYPAALVNVVAVASTDANNNQSSFSNQGTYVELAAPGSSVYSSYLAGQYATISGTSQAAPHVAGLAALIWSQDRGLTHENVRTQMRSTATDLGAGGWDPLFGYGLIDAGSATGLSQLLPLTSNPLPVADPAASDFVEVSFVPGEILFKPRLNVGLSELIDGLDLSSSELRVTGTIDQIGVQRLAVPAGQEQFWLDKLRASRLIEYVELNYVVTIQ
jgi:type VII secretion-associated serine protease mycosin